MGAIAIDLNNTDEVIIAGRQALVNGLGVAGARAFLNNYTEKRNGRPRITAEEFAKIKAQAEAEAEAGRGKGEGDYTKEKQERPDGNAQTLAEYTAEVMRVQAMMDEVEREHPEMTAGQIGAEAAKRMVAMENAVIINAQNKKKH